MDKFKYPDAWDQIVAGRDKMFPSTTCKMMADKIRRFLIRRFGQVAKEAANTGVNITTTTLHLVA